jgi:hypothetical protein
MIKNCKHPINNRVNFHDNGYHCTACGQDVAIEKPSNKPPVVYLVGRTTGVEKLNLGFFNTVEGFLNKYGYETVKQHDLFDDFDHNALSQQEQMQRRYEAMDQCDMVLILPDWMECSYARAEQTYARTMQMDVRNYTTFCSSHRLCKNNPKASVEDLRQVINKPAA